MQVYCRLLSKKQAADCYASILHIAKQETGGRLPRKCIAGGYAREGGRLICKYTAGGYASTGGRLLRKLLQEAMQDQAAECYATILQAAESYASIYHITSHHIASWHHILFGELVPQMWGNRPSGCGGTGSPSNLDRILF